MTSSRLSLTVDARDSILSHAHESAADDPPTEVCGIPADDSNACTVTTTRPVSNIAAEPRVAYELDPKKTVPILEAIGSTGDDAVGFCHSCPESDPVPSVADRERTSWPGYVYLICLPDGRMTAHGWVGDEFCELSVAVERLGSRPVAVE